MFHQSATFKNSFHIWLLFFLEMCLKNRIRQSNIISTDIKREFVCRPTLLHFCTQDTIQRDPCDCEKSNADLWASLTLGPSKPLHLIVHNPTTSPRLPLPRSAPLSFSLLRLLPTPSPCDHLPLPPLRASRTTTPLSSPLNAARSFSPHHCLPMPPLGAPT